MPRQPVERSDVVPDPRLIEEPEAHESVELHDTVGVALDPADCPQPWPHSAQASLEAPDPCT
jgi:hypothetical protein